MGGVVRRYNIDFLTILLIPTPLVYISSFFSFLFVIFVQYSKRCSKNIRDG